MTFIEGILATTLKNRSPLLVDVSEKGSTNRFSKRVIIYRRRHGSTSSPRTALIFIVMLSSWRSNEAFGGATITEHLSNAVAILCRFSPPPQNIQ